MNNATTFYGLIIRRLAVQVFYLKYICTLLNTTYLNNKLCLDSGLGLVITVHNCLY